jgi:hypothetical protein
MIMTQSLVMLPLTQVPLFQCQSLPLMIPAWPDTSGPHLLLQGENTAHPNQTIRLFLQEISLKTNTTCFLSYMKSKNVHLNIQ